MRGLLATCADVLQPGEARRQSHVVIVGASFGGLTAQRELSRQRDLKVTLIDFKRYFEYTPGVRSAIPSERQQHTLVAALPLVDA